MNNIANKPKSNKQTIFVTPKDPVVEVTEKLANPRGRRVLHSQRPAQCDGCKNFHCQ